MPSILSRVTDGDQARSHIVALGSGEHRLPACSSRQLAAKQLCFISTVCVRQMHSAQRPNATGWQPVLPRPDCQITSKRLVATSFVIEVGKLRGAESGASSFEATVQLVDTQLEMVCTDRLPDNFRSLSCLCRFNSDGRFQRDQVDRSLQRRLRQS